jgi:hypothetical protein
MLSIALAVPPFILLFLWRDEMEFLEPDATKNEWREDHTALYSIAISLKRIADLLGGIPDTGNFLTQLHGVLNDASHDHAQRMR